MFGERIDAARRSMSEQGVDALLLSVGADLPYLTGYRAMALPRLTMLVLPRDGDARLVIPALEAPRVDPRPEFTLRTWTETEDPLDIVADLVGPATTVAIGDTTWSRFLVGLVDRCPGVRFRNASEIMSPLRAVKSAGEVAMLRAAAAAVDRIAARLQGGEIDLVGRTEAEVSTELGRQIIRKNGGLIQ